jgi:TP901 family phage tail tape measure protein
MAGLNAAETKMRSTSEKFSQLASSAGRMGAAFTAVGAGVAYVAASFEKELTRAAAIADNTGKNFDFTFQQMSERSLELAAKTQFTGRQVGEAFTFMSMAGNTLSSSMKAMPSVLQLASAAAIDLGQSADIVTNVMAGFGITLDQLQQGLDRGDKDLAGFGSASEAMSAKLKDANNVLVATFTNSNTSLTELGASFRKVGPASKLMGVSMEDTASALGILGNAGIKAEEAGTGLRRAFVAMDSPLKKTRKAMSGLGIEAGDLGKRGFLNIVNQLVSVRKQFSDAGRDADFNAKLFEAFGLRAGPIMGALVAQGTESLVKLRENIGRLKKENIAEILEERQLSTFAGQFDLLKSNVEAVVISFGQKLLPVLKPVVKGISDMMKSINKISPQMKKAIAVTVMVAGAFMLAVSALATFGAIVTGITASLIGLFFVAPMLAGISLAFIKIATVVGAVLVVIGMIADVFLDETNEMGQYGEDFGVGFVETMKNVGRAVLTAFYTVTQGIAKAFDWLAETVLDILFGIPQAMTFIVDVAAMMFRKLIQGAGNLAAGFVRMLVNLPGVGDMLGLSDSDVEKTRSKVNKMVKGLDATFDIDLTGDIERAKKDIQNTTFKLAATESPEELADLTFRAIEYAFESGASGWQKIAKSTFGLGADEISKKMKGALAETQDLLKTRKVKLDAPVDDESVDRQKKIDDARERLRRIIKREADELERLNSETPQLVGSFQKFKDKIDEIKEIEKIANDTGLASKAMDQLRRTTIASITKQMQAITSTEELSKAMGELKRRAGIVPMADDMGSSVKPLTDEQKTAAEVIKNLEEGTRAFRDKQLKADVGKGLEDIFSELAYEVINVVSTGKSEAKEAQARQIKGLAQTLGPMLSKSLSGQAPSIGAAIGAAIGSRMTGDGGAPLTKAGQEIGRAVGEIASNIGSVVGGAISGAVSLVSSGIMFIVDFIVDTLKSMKPFTDMMKIAQTVFGMLVERLNPLQQVLFPIVGLFAAFLGVFQPFVDGFVNLLVSMRQEIFDFTRQTFLMLGNAVLAVTIGFNGLIVAIQHLAPAISGLVNGIGIAFDAMLTGVRGFISWLGSLDWAPELAGGIDEMLSSLDGVLVGMRGMGREASDAVDSFLDNLSTVDTGMMRDALDMIAGMTIEEAERLALLLRDANDTMNESLTNVPQGFKVALERFRAIDPALGSPTAGQGFGDGDALTQGLFIENIYLQVADPEDFADQMSRIAQTRNLQQGGGLTAAQLPIGGSF